MKESKMKIYLKNVMRKKKVYVFIIILFIFACSTSVDFDSNKPNIIFIVVDDLGWSDLGCYGADLHETPNIDRFAEESVVFTNSYAAAPVCSPTRASLMTGKYPARLNFTIWSEAASPAERKNQEKYKYLPPQTLENLPFEEVTLAEKLKEKGYLTAHVGKWHIGDLVHFPETQGFDISVAASQRGAPPTFFYPYKGFAFGEFRFVGNLGADPEGHYFTDREGEYLTDRLTDEALKIIKDAGTQPFFLNLCYYSVHTPIEAKEKDIEHFKQNVSPEFYHQNATYAGMVKAVDDNVGRILKQLKKSGLDENTAVFLLSDNGGYINKYKDVTVTNNTPLRSGKGSLYEGGIRIPTIVRLPGNSLKGKKIDTPVSTIDFFPTIMDMLDIEDNPAVDGKSFLSLLKDDSESESENRDLFWHYPHYYPTTTPASAVRADGWKLIEYLGDNVYELYNLKTDPGETKNLVEENPEKVSELLEKLHNWKKSLNASTVTLNPDYKEN